MLCYRCGAEIYFDDNIYSTVTGKKLPIDYNGELHICPMPCNRCGASIYFDEDMRSESGKMIPLDFDSGDPHDCMLAQVKKDIETLKRHG